MACGVFLKASRDSGRRATHRSRDGAYSVRIGNSSRKQRQGGEMKATELRLGTFYLDPHGRPCMCVRKTEIGCFINALEGKGVITIEVHDDAAGDCFLPHPEPSKALGGRYNLKTLERFEDHA
jgi:hypothetical protein